MKILLATDGSEYSKGAARFLTCLNLSLADEIIIFHAVTWLPYHYEKDFFYDTFKEIKREIAPRILDTSFEILKSVNAKISTAIMEGPPGQSIVDAAAESDVDLIVMGARGLKGIKSLFIGSVTRSVALNSSKPVLVIKLPTCEQPGKLNILFASDGSDHSIATGELLSSIPFRDDTGLTILNVVLPVFVDIPETLVPEIIEKFDEIAERTKAVRISEAKRIIDHTKEMLSKKFRNIAILTEIGDPSAEILKTSETLKADVIAVGSRGLRGIKETLGSVSRNILIHSKCSVLIGKT